MFDPMDLANSVLPEVENDVAPEVVPIVEFRSNMKDVALIMCSEIK